MNTKQLLSMLDKHEIEICSKVKYCYFSYTAGKRIWTYYGTAALKKVKYIYQEDDCIVIETEEKE